MMVVHSKPVMQKNIEFRKHKKYREPIFDEHIFESFYTSYKTLKRLILLKFLSLIIYIYIYIYI